MQPHRRYSHGWQIIRNHIIDERRVLRLGLWAQMRCAYFFHEILTQMESYGLRAASSAPGVIPRRTVQSTEEQWLWILYCKSLTMLNSLSHTNQFSCICTVFCSLMNIAYLSWKNKLKARTGRRELLLEKYNQDEDPSLRAWMELGDEHPDFRYTLWVSLQFLLISTECRYSLSMTLNVI